jgi:hypothetical protein
VPKRTFASRHGRVKPVALLQSDEIVRQCSNPESLLLQ